MYSIQQIITENIVPEDFVVRYRFLSDLSQHPLKLKRKLEGGERKGELPSYLIEGSLIDSLLTETPDTTNSRFRLLEAPVPPEKAKIFVDSVIEKYGEGATKEQVFEVAREIEFGGKTWKEDTLWSKFIEHEAYIKEKLIDDDRIPVDVQTMIMCRHLTEQAKTDPVVSRYLQEENLIQKPTIKYNLNVSGISLNFESEIDMLWVDREKKIIRVLELKSYSGSFNRNYYSYGYYYQASLYTTGLIRWIDTQEEFKGFTILPPLFIALNKNMVDIPRLYQMPEHHLGISTFGGNLNAYSEPITGWMEFSLDFLWHTVNDLWNYRRRVYENDCIEIL